MPCTDRFAERIGAVFLPEAETVEQDEDFTPNPEGPIPFPDPPFPDPGPFPTPQLPHLPLPKWPPDPFPWPFKICSTSLKRGLLHAQLRADRHPIFGTRYRGTLRVEPHGRRRPHVRRPVHAIGCSTTSSLAAARVGRSRGSSMRAVRSSPRDEAADTGGTIPIYRRRVVPLLSEGHRARSCSRSSPKGASAARSRSTFDEFVYNHPATGFSGVVQHDARPRRCASCCAAPRRRTCSPATPSRDTTTARHRVDPLDLDVLPARRPADQHAPGRRDAAPARSARRRSRASSPTPAGTSPSRTAGRSRCPPRWPASTSTRAGPRRTCTR